jgi:polysaccharide export outer membrane protein
VVRPIILACLRVAGLAAVLGASAARADYLVGRGDVLSVVVLEAPTIGREAKVDADGRIMLPMLGGVPAAGSDLPAIRSRIEEALVAMSVVLRPTVLVEIARYRPFYVGGAVAKPGAVDFEPGLTVRHALILGGGVSAGAGAADPEDALELAANWRIGSTRLAELRSRVARLEAELRDEPDAPPAPDAAQADAVAPPEAIDAADIRAIDAALLRDGVAARAADEAHLRRTLVLIDLEIGVLAEQARLQGEEQALQRQEMEGVRSLQDKGLAPLQRVQGLEREASRLRRDMLDNQAFSARARLNRAAVDHEIRAARTERRIALTSSLREAVLERGRLEAELDLLAGRLRSGGMAVGGDGVLTAPVPAVAIHRVADGKQRTIDADMETEVQPGDILEVTLRRPENG